MDRILIIEDGEELHQSVAKLLAEQACWLSVECDRSRAFERVQEESPNLVIVVLGRNGTGRLDLCERLKTHSSTSHIPLIIVSEGGNDDDVVRSLDLGASDYIRHPLSPQQQVARVLAVLRREPAREEPTLPPRVSRSGLDIDVSRHEVRLDGRIVPLTAAEFRLLHFLASHPGQVFGREQLLRRITTNSARVTDRNVDVYIRVLRKKLSPRAHLIGTIRGVGYRFQPED
jgi:two-component system phosphate regulon response regulator PhoB